MTSLTYYPAVIIIGLHGKEELDIIKGIINEALPQKEVCDYLEKYKWCIDNKYYKAEIQLCKVKNHDNISPSAFESSEAVIVYIDCSKVLALNDVDEILNCLQHNQTDVKLLVCDGFTDGNAVLTKGKAQEWCIDHGWELVELNIETTDSEHEDDLEDDFIDSWGFTRIKQALNAHTWSNLQLKDKEDSSIGHLVKQMTLKDNKSEPKVPYEKLDSKQTENECDINFDEEDNFSALFSSLGEMKEKADSLPPEERRVYAEKIAMAFLKSLGDEEETEGLDSDNEQT